VQETEALLKATEESTAKSKSQSEVHQAEISKLRQELQQSKGVAKEEEEKRVKAISLLKTVRQKLVKADKDREEAVKELNAIKTKEKDDKDKHAAEKVALQQEIDAVNMEREKAVKGLKTQFDREVVGHKERSDRELVALRGQFELEALSAKVNACYILHEIVAKAGTRAHIPRKFKRRTRT
jgi:hypothetical protein